MKKILMRAAMSPFDNPDFFALAKNNMIGGNIGNLLFARSVARATMIEGYSIETTRDHRWSDEEAERFNNEYECFLIPLANAFRPEFIKQLNNLSDLIERLTIPCVVIGVGIQAPVTYRGGVLPFDNDVKRFMSCVLDKSSIVGIRGESTAVYLEHLGYIREKDFTIIGCPSMYLYGGRLPYFEKKELTSDSHISVNLRFNLVSDAHHSYMKKNLDLLHNYSYVVQTLDEMYSMYIGKAFSEKKYREVPSRRLRDLSLKLYSAKHAIGFLNASSWLEYMKECEFAFGSRIHGNISALLSGVPCFVISADARMQELADYHHIPSMPYSKVPDDATVFDLYEKADYSDMFKNHTSNFQHFIDFLDANQISHIYKECDYVEKCPFDRKINEIQFRSPIKAFATVSRAEQLERLNKYYATLESKK